MVKNKCIFWGAILLIATIFCTGAIYADSIYEIESDDFGFSYYGDDACDVFAYLGSDKDITVPAFAEGRRVETLYKICEAPLVKTLQINTIKVSEGIKYIGDYAFDGIDGLRTLYLPASLERIDSYALSTWMGEPVTQEIVFAGSESMWEYLSQNTFFLDGVKIVCADSGAPVVNVTTNPSNNSFTYDGKKHYLELLVKHSDGTPVDSQYYSITYDSDCTSVGMQYVTITFFGDYAIKNYSGTYTYSILPGKTEKVDVEIVGNDAKISWKAVPGATHYRLCMFDEAVGYYKELLWGDGSIEAPYLTKTVSGLEKGKTYKMSVKAVWWSEDGQRAAPSEQEKVFEVRIPLPGEKVSSGESTENEVTSATDEITEETSDDETTKDDVATDSQATEKTEENTTKEEKETGEIDKMGGDGKKGNLFSRYLVGAVVVIAEVVVLAGVSLYIVIKKKK